jgi:peptidoglycan/LPS O-acetylase OafA/YrhL
VRFTEEDDMARARQSPPLSLHEKIDICRGVFAALVVMAHALETAWGVHPEAKRRLPETVRNVLDSVFGLGIYYVMGFFVLSGYCIHLSVARSMREERFPIRRYMVARLSRILPLYYLALLFTLAVEWTIAGHRPRQWPHGLDAATFLGQVLMVQNLSQTFGSFAASWSITNEVFYYLLYGLLALLAAGRASRPAWLGLAISAGAAAVTQLLYVTVARTPVVYASGMLLGLGMLWFPGALVAIHGEAWVQNRWLRRIARLWPIVLAGAIAWQFFRLPPQGVYLVSGFAFVLMMLHFIATSPAETPANVSPWRSALVTTSGLSSYPMYLFHGPISMLAGSFLIRSGLVSDWLTTWALLLVIGVVSGVVLGWVLERPVMVWRAAFLRRWKEKDRADGSPSVAAIRPAALGARVAHLTGIDRHRQEVAP